MPSIIGEPFHKYVADQINIRQSYHGVGADSPYGRPDKSFAYLNSKTAWLKLASGVSIDERDWKKGYPSWYNRHKQENLKDEFKWTGLAKHHVLFGGISHLQGTVLHQRGTASPPPDIGGNIADSYWGTYNVGATNSHTTKTPGEFGLVPEPGLISADIKCLNRGSIRKATVLLKCYSADQFKIIELLYLRLGYTVFLEWGWGEYLDNEGSLTSDYYTLIEDTSGFFNTDAAASTHRKMLNKINGYRAAKNGNYDGLLAKVCNFSWTLGGDGIYNIQLDLISLGDVIESLKINITPSKVLYNIINDRYSLYKDYSTEAEVQEDKSISSSPADNFISAFLFLQKIYADVRNSPQGIPKEIILNANECTVPCFVAGSRIPLPGWFVIPPTDGSVLGEGIEITWRGLTSFTDQVLTGLYVLATTNAQENWVHSLDAGKYSNYPLHPDSPDPPTLPPTFDCWWVTNVLALADDIHIYTAPKTVNSSDLPTQGPKDSVFINYNDESGDEDEMMSNKGFYMRLGCLLNVINNHIIPKIENSLEPIVSINTSIDNKMYLFPYQFSLDPRVCIVKTVNEKINTKQFFTTLEDFKNAPNGFAHTMNIYMANEFIQTCISDNLDKENNLSLFDFLVAMCDGINISLGGQNSLEPVIDEETNTISLIDSSYNPLLKSKQYELELYGYNPNKDKNSIYYELGTTSNFCRDFAIKTEITNEFATMATIGSTAGGYVKGTENTMFSKWSRGLIDRFKEKIVPGDKSSRKAISDGVAEPREQYIDEIWMKTYSAFGCTMLDVTDDYNFFWSYGDSLGLSDEIINKNISTATEFYKFCQSEIPKTYNKSYSSPTAGFIPIGLNITLDGISGIKIYNSINVSTRFLPSNYPDSLKFIIKAVNHSIKDNDWETTIETIAISENEE